MPAPTPPGPRSSPCSRRPPPLGRPPAGTHRDGALLPGRGQGVVEPTGPHHRQIGGRSLDLLAAGIEVADGTSAFVTARRPAHLVVVAGGLGVDDDHVDPVVRVIGPAELEAIVNG